MSNEPYPPPPPSPYGYGMPMPAGDPQFAPLRGATMGQAVQRFFQRYAQFRGRSSRSEYWWPQLMVILAVIVLEVLVRVSPVFGILGLALLGLIIPGIAVTVRRLHDINRSGWWYFLGFVPIVGGIILLVWCCTDSKPEGARHRAPIGVTRCSDR